MGKGRETEPDPATAVRRKAAPEQRGGRGRKGGAILTLVLAAVGIGALLAASRYFNVHNLSPQLGKEG